MSRITLTDCEFGWVGLAVRTARQPRTTIRLGRYPDHALRDRLRPALRERWDHLERVWREDLEDGRLNAESARGFWDRLRAEYYESIRVDS